MQTTHITVNSRLSSHLKQQAVLQASSKVVQTPEVMTLSQWWQAWQQKMMLTAKLPSQPLPKKILNSFEAQWLFERCLQKQLKEQLKDKAELESDKLELLNVAATAKLLYQAWNTNCEWLGANHEQQLKDYSGSAEVDLYLKVVKRYLTELQNRKCQDQALFSHTQLNWLHQVGGIGTQREFYLHGFDELSPNVQTWKKTVETLGARVSSDTVEGGDNEFSLNHQPLICYPAQDPYDETQQVAIWAINQLKKLQQHKPIHAIKIAIVAPDLAEYRQTLSLCLDEQLYQQGLSKQPIQNNLSDKALYNISLGESLASVPLVASALQSLQLFLQPEKTINYQSWSQWLISPYSAGNMTQRQQADAEFRKLQWAQLKWPKLLETKAANYLPEKLVKQVEAWLKMIAKQDAFLSLSDFSESVSTLLKTLHWPGNRTLSSVEFQQKTAFENTLQQFSSLTDIGGKQTVSAWLQLFNRYLAETVHQPQTPGHQPIQIMGMLEAGGQSFDALWILGLTNESWPRPASPNPFIPAQLQRQNAMPRSDASRELLYAQQISQRLVDSADQVFWSYPKQVGEATYLPTSILTGLEKPSVQAWQTQIYQSLSQNLFQQASDKPRLNWELDAIGTELPQGAKAPGGTGILLAQSKCPLMAYIDYRLGAKYGMQQVEDSLQNTNQGSLVHTVLEWFWQETKTQTALLAMTVEQRVECLKTQIERAFETLQTGLSEGIQSVEKHRILDLCLQWLDMESQRQAFSIYETEQEHQLVLSGIEFKIIIDRVDLVDGEAVILDYKTGKASINALLSTPLQAPQLAVYLLAVEQSVAGIGYGLLHSDDGVRISAISEQKGTISAARSIQVFSRLAEKQGGDFYQVSWNDFLDHLKQQVIELADQVRQGRAEMSFASWKDIEYANGYLALRVPEVSSQIAAEIISHQSQGTAE